MFCDEFPHLHEERYDKGINFTGKSWPGDTPCPGVEARGLESLNSWGGNVAKPADPDEEDLAYHRRKVFGALDIYNDVKKRVATRYANRCPTCNKEGVWRNLALTCEEHGVFG